MILGFKPQFKQPILDGTKIHTVRFTSKRRIKQGTFLHLATGVRTKFYSCFLKQTCTGTQRVFMSINVLDQLEVSIDGKELFGRYEREEFANNDGFKSWYDLEDWFYAAVKKSEDQCASGVLIHWTEFRY